MCHRSTYAFAAKFSSTKSLCMLVSLQRWLWSVPDLRLMSFIVPRHRLSTPLQAASFATAVVSNLRFFRIEGGRSRSSNGAAYVSSLTSAGGSTCAPPLRPAFRSAALSSIPMFGSAGRRSGLSTAGRLAAVCCQCFCQSPFHSSGSPSNTYTPPNAAVLIAYVT